MQHIYCFSSTPLKKLYKIVRILSNFNLFTPKESSKMAGRKASQRLEDSHDLQDFVGAPKHWDDRQS